MRFSLRTSLACTVVLLTTSVVADDAALRRQAAAGLKKACRFFDEVVSAEGGYLWRYSEDLAVREGEGKANATTVWVQPPGTPTVGTALLDAYKATGDDFHLDAARRTGHCLVRGQLRSGGWDYRIVFDEKERARRAYRVDRPLEGKSQGNTSTLDDDTTQAALRFLMALDAGLQQSDAAIHEAAMTGLEALLAVQYPIGAWPQRFEGPPRADDFPIRQASYPDSWSWEYPGKDYKTFYTFNDNAIADVIDVMFLAAEQYGDRRFRAAAERAGQFMLLAQMPDPQPGWAQQYDANMQPAWARKFEPPAVTGGESQGVMRALMEVYRRTGDKKYLEPIPRALQYYRRSLLADGRLARFYELRTNRPLYFTKDYQLTYSDADMPTHYSFKVGSSLDQIEREFERLSQTPIDQRNPPAKKAPQKPSKSQESRVRSVLASLDSQGRWVENGRMRYHGDADPTRRVISCERFVANVRVLAGYLATAP